MIAIIDRCFTDSIENQPGYVINVVCLMFQEMVPMEVMQLTLSSANSCVAMIHWLRS